MRGFFGGLVIGLVTIVIAVVALSLLSPAARRPDVAQDAPQSVTDGAPTGSVTGVTASGADGDLVELAPTALGAQPDAQAGGHDDLTPLRQGDTQAGDKPKVGGATAGLGDPGTAPGAPGVVVNTDDAPITVPAPADAPSTPQGDSQPIALGNPAQPSVPDVSQTGSGFGTGPAVEDPSPAILATSDPAPSSTGGGTASPAPGAEPSPSQVTNPSPAPDQTANPAQAQAPEKANAAPDPEMASASEPAPQSGATSVPPVPQLDKAAPQEPTPPRPTQEPANPQIAVLPQAGADGGAPRPRIGTPVVPLTQRDTGVSEAPVESVPDSVGLPPLEAFGMAFENPDNRPIMSIVLIDDAMGLGAEALAEFPYPLTFAIDPADPEAAAKMARHRAAGFEVVALIDLPETATAQDAEVTLSVWLDSVPQVVALLEGTGTGVQGNRDLSDQVTAIASGKGLGLIMQGRGLNTAYKLAARDGVPAALVFRDFDGAGQAPTVIRRFLDQAAFRAGQQGAVIMLGRLRPDTISALLLWGLQDRASRVALAPVSAALKR